MTALQTTADAIPRIDIQIGHPTGPDWLAPAQFFTSPHFERLLGHSRDAYQTDSRVLLGNLMLAKYTWVVLGSTLAAYLLDRRVPALEDIRVHVGEEYVDGIAFTSGRFAGLPDDPAATVPECVTLSSPNALRGHLRLTIESHMVCAICMLRQQIPVHPRSLWPAIADRCAGTIAWYGHQLGVGNATICHETEQLIHAPRSPLNNPITGLIPVTNEGRTRLFLKRAACCHSDRRGYDLCDTCPKWPIEQRVERLRDLHMTT